MKKRYIKGSIILLLAMMISAVLSGIGVSAAGEVYEESDGIRTAYLSGSETVTLSDGTTRNAYNTLSSALTALDVDGGRVYVCGEITDSTSSFTDVLRTSPVLVTGLTGNTTDILTIDCTIRMGGSFTFDNFTLKTTTSGRYLYGGHGDKYFGPGFKIAGITYYCNYSKNISASDVVPRRTFFNTKASFASVSASSDSINFGTSALTEPVLSEIVVDDITMDTENLLIDDVRNAMSTYGNVNLIVNGGTFKDNSSLSYGNDTITGVITAILNNGTAEKFTTYTDELDYVVKSAVGGTVSINTQAPFGGAPEFLFTPQDNKVPTVNGEAVSLSDGKYLYTPEAADTQTILEVKWVDKPEETVKPQVYTIGGKPSVFISDTQVITENGMKYGAYPGLKEAFAALGADGGVIYVYGTVHDSTRTDIGRVTIDGKTARDHVLIRGWTSDAALHFYTTLNINAGPTTFENFTLNPTATNGTPDDTSDDTVTATWYMTGSENTVFGKNFKVKWVNQNSGSPRIYYRAFMSENFTQNKNTEHRTVFASKEASFLTVNIGGYRDSFGSADSDDPALAELVFDDVFLYSSINAGFSDPADYQNRIYGNVNVYVNGGNFYNKKVTLSNINASNYHTGRTTVIFNNGMNADKVWAIDAGVDYVVNSAAGGKVEIYEQAPFGGAPTFEFIPEKEGYTALINGETILAVDKIEGKIFYTPNIPLESDASVSGTNPEGTVTEVLDVEWIEIPNTCVVSFDANGGAGTVPESIEHNRGEVLSLSGVQDAELTMKNSVFLGWNTKRYANEALVSITVPESEAVTLYAVWQHDGVTLSDSSAASAKDVGGIRVSTVEKDELEQNNSVLSAIAALENEPLNIAGFEAVYAFDVKVFDKEDNEISSFDETDFEIALSVLPALSVGECYVIYREDNSIDFSVDADHLAFSDTESGTYTVAVMNSKTATYTYKLLSYNKNSGEYILALYFDGTDASYGTFGLGYDAEKLEFVSFTPSSDVDLTGGEIGFGTYLCEDGVYRNTWEASNGSYISAQDAQVEIGRFLFSARSEITDSSVLFAKAIFADADTVLPEGVADTVYDTDENVYLYAPMVPSTYVYCQPTTEVFDLEAQKTAVKVTVKVVTEREYGKAAVNDAIVTILFGNETVLSLSEKEAAVSSSAGGKTVLEFSAELMPGEYTLTIRKNGYLAHTSAFTVSGDGAAIPDITLVCGDIKGAMQDVCGDGRIDIDDFVRVLRGFSQDVIPEIKTAVDLNEDGSINVTDIAIVKKNFGKSSVGR